ncbi:MAG: hypothetical protein NT164_07480 [Verrucomicrobiae bacterium]|nr:hypothetical protein [Verrucomicrobiae bacterium]
MNKGITVHLHHIPENESLHLTGEANSVALDLEEAGIGAVGPLFYDLQVGISDGGLFATGTLSQTMRMTCVGCLEFFEWQFETKEFAMQKELSGSELVDLTPEVREDIHLLLPMHPRCTLGGNKCPAQFPQRLVSSSEISEIRSVWAALDNITH